jgi:hypothetical protein
MPDLNTPTKLLGGSGIILTHAHEFSYDVPGDHFVFDRPGAVDVPFVFSSSQSFSQDASVAVLTVRLHINGVAIPGVYVKRTISNANTIGVVGMSGHFTLSDGDYLELWAESTKTGDFDAWSFNSELKEDPA